MKRNSLKKWTLKKLPENLNYFKYTYKKKLVT